MYTLQIKDDRFVLADEKGGYLENLHFENLQLGTERLYGPGIISNIWSEHSDKTFHLEIAFHKGDIYPRVRELDCLCSRNRHWD